VVALCVTWFVTQGMGKPAPLDDLEQAYAEADAALAE